MLNVAVLVSGGGTNLQAILDAKAAGALPHAKIALVLASKPGVYALERASKAGVPGIVVARKSYAAPEEYDAALLAALREHRIDVVVLAVKPQILEGVLAEIAPQAAGRLFLSVAAGKELAWLEARLGHEAIIRAMPNINAVVGASVTGWCANDAADTAQRELAARLLGTFGTAVEVPEKFMGIVGAIGGAAPAYTYLYINALAEAAVQAGMPKGMAVEIAAAMAEGSGRMVRLSGRHPWALIDQVTSPGGTTVEGLLALQQGGFEPAVHAAVQAVLEKDKRM